MYDVQERKGSAVVFSSCPLGCTINEWVAIVCNISSLMPHAVTLSSCALVALVLATAFEEDVPLEGVLARERPPALADVRLGVAVHVLVPLEVVVALERGLADAADVRARRVRAGRRGRGRRRGRARGAAVGAVQVCGRRVVRVVRVARAISWAGRAKTG